MSDESVIWPTFYIVGAPKCGTTSVWAYLREHPQVFLPDLKEPNFFSIDSVPENRRPKNKSARSKWFLRCCGNQEEYNRIYQPGRGFPALGDASSTYLMDQNAARRIDEVCPDARIVIMLRDPILRAHSHYLANHNSKASYGVSFMQEIQEDLAMKDRGWWNAHLHVDLGMYCDQVRRYFDTFGRNNVLILLTEDLTKRPKEVLSELTQHLGIDQFPETIEFTGTVHNPYREPRAKGLYRILRSEVSLKLRDALLPESVKNRLRNSKLLYSFDKPELEDEPRRLLQEIFDPEIRCLEELLGRELPALRKSWK